MARTDGLLTEETRPVILELLNMTRSEKPVTELVAVATPIGFCDDDLELLTFYSLHVNGNGRDVQSFWRLWAICPACNKCYVTHYIAGMQVLRERKEKAQIGEKAD